MSRVKLYQFIDYVLNFHRAFQFTFDIPEKQVEFWDINILVCSNRLSTSVHHKDSGSHSYL